ncbi:MAG: peptidase M61, partial [Candidatus Acidiferrum sp.]
GELRNVWWGSPAFKAGMTPDMVVTAVNGQAFSVAVLRAAILRAEKGASLIKLLVKRGNDFQTIEINYTGGLRYPALTRGEGVPDRLDEILAPE